MNFTFHFLYFLVLKCSFGSFVSISPLIFLFCLFNNTTFSFKSLKIFLFFLKCSHLPIVASGWSLGPFLLKMSLILLLQLPLPLLLILLSLPPPSPSFPNYGAYKTSNPTSFSLHLHDLWQINIFRRFPFGNNGDNFAGLLWRSNKIMHIQTLALNGRWLLLDFEISLVTPVIFLIPPS